jgi:hypothetical protein
MRSAGSSGVAGKSIALAIISIACIATACTGLSINRAVDYDTATATVAALLSAVAENDQAKVDALTTHSDTPPPSRESLAIVARAVGSPAASSTVADSFFDDPAGALNDIDHLPRSFETVGELEAYEWDADFHALSLKFACAPSNGPRCANRLYFTFARGLGDARVDMIIGVRNNPAWAKLWKDLPNSQYLKPATPAPAVAQAFARFKASRLQSAN